MRITIFLILAILVGQGAEAQKKDKDFVAKGDKAKELTRLFDRCQTIGLRGSILVAKDGKDGKVLIARGMGDENLKGGNHAETLFEIASVTKQFTAAAILKLADMKKLSLGDSIVKHLPNIPDNCKSITIRHLLQHTSGISDSNSAGGGDDLETVIPKFLKGGPQHDPGTHWEYWNQGYSLLAGVIERKSKMSYANFCRQQLFKKAKMKTACFTGDPRPKKARVALGHSERGNRTALAHPYGAYGYQYRGMGGAVCNLGISGPGIGRWTRAPS